MFHIDTTTPRWRRLATTGLALPMSLLLSGTALASGPAADLQVQEPSSTAAMTIDVSCFTVNVTSDKDISNVKVTFADGSFQEIERLSGSVFEETFSKQIASATAKSATTTVSDDAGACAVETAPVEEVPEEETPDENVTAPANGTANISIEVDCNTVSVLSDKDISNVKVTFADGTRQEIEGLSGYTFERTFDKEVASATAKSATTTVEGSAEACAVQAPAEELPAEEIPEEQTPAPVCPTVPVMGPIMEGCEPVEPVVETPAQETPADEAPVEETPVVTTPIDGQPAPQPATGEETPVLETPGEETPVVSTPIGGQPAPQPATGEETPAQESPVAETPAQQPTPISGQPAAAPATGVVNNGAVAPAVVTPAVVTAAPATGAATPTALPFTGADAGMLAGLGSLLLLVGGGAVVAGRRERVALSA